MVSGILANGEGGKHANGKTSNNQHRTPNIQWGPGDWKVTRTRRLKSRRYIHQPAYFSVNSTLPSSTRLAGKIFLPVTFRDSQLIREGAPWGKAASKSATSL